MNYELHEYKISFRQFIRNLIFVGYGNKYIVIVFFFNGEGGIEL